MRILPWLAIVLWGAYLFWGVEHARRLGATCSATRALSANHRVASGDVKCGDPGISTLFTGLYLTGDVAAGADLRLTDLITAPSLSFSPANALFELKVRVADVPRERLEPRAVSALVAGAAVPERHAVLVAIVCEDRQASECVAVFEVKRAALAALTAADPATIQVVDPSKVKEPAAGPPQRSAPPAKTGEKK